MNDSGDLDRIAAVEGVGPSTLAALREAGLDSTAAVAATPATELADQVEGVGAVTAERIHRALDGTDLSRERARARIRRALGLDGGHASAPRVHERARESLAGAVEGALDATERAGGGPPAQDLLAAFVDRFLRAGRLRPDAAPPVPDGTTLQWPTAGQEFVAVDEPGGVDDDRSRGRFVDRTPGERFDRARDRFLAERLGAGADPETIAAARAGIDRVGTAVVDHQRTERAMLDKPPVVRVCGHLVPAGRVPEALRPVIAEAQAPHWRVFGVEDPAPGTFDRRPTLPVDTAALDRDTRRALLSAVEYDPDGWLVRGDNYRALGALDRRFGGEVACIYVDPPYNTGNDVAYRDDFPRGAWLSMLDGRLQRARQLLAEDGVILVSIDDNEMARLRLLMDRTFGEENLLAELVWDRKTGTTQGQFKRAHEYVLAYARDRTALNSFEFDPALEKLHDFDSGVIRHSALKRVSEKNPPSEITFPAGIDYAGEKAVFTDEIPGSERTEIVDGPMVFEDGELAAPVTLRAGWAMRDQILEWLETGEARDSKGQRVRRFFFSESGKLRYEKERATMHPQTVLRSGPDGFGSTRTGSTELAALLGEAPVEFPKPVDLVAHLVGLCTGDGDVVVDFFAGSGTTGHAVERLNREREADVRYVLVEAGEHFETVLRPRVERVRYAPTWEGGDPVDPPGPGTDPGGIVRYERLETHGESLDAVRTGDRESGGGDRTESPGIADGESEPPGIGYRPRPDGTVGVDPPAVDAAGDWHLDAGPRGALPVDPVWTAVALLGLDVTDVRAAGASLVVEGRTGDRRALVVGRPTDAPDRRLRRIVADADLAFATGDPAVEGVTPLAAGLEGLLSR